ncbi:MAG: polysaccharide biosynthesis/export family protein [Bacteroidota bacterium]
MKFNTLVTYVFSLVIMGSLFSCTTSKQLAYFQDLKDTGNIQKVAIYPYEPLRLQIDDDVQIIISSTSPEASQYFNLAAGTVSPTGPASTAGGIATPGAGSNISIYKISLQGKITLPVLGEIYIVGLTTDELKLKLYELLKPYIKDVIVSVALVNFKVTVIGEVRAPVTVPGKGERLNVLEAIGAAGDMTEFSNRYNVKVMRKVGDSVQVAHLNFNTSKIMQSPFYQLKQNDVVYVEPNINKGFRSERFSIILPFVISITSLLLTVSTILR